MPKIFKFTPRSNSSVIKRLLEYNSQHVDYAEVKLIEEQGKAPYFAVVGFKDTGNGVHYAMSVVVPLGQTSYWFENSIEIYTISYKEFKLFKEFTSDIKYKDCWVLVSSSEIDWLVGSLRTREGRKTLGIVLFVTLLLIAFLVVTLMMYY